jgi:hypothetical protein
MENSMARIAATASIDQIVLDAGRPIVVRASQAIAQSMASMVAERLGTELTNSFPRRAARAPTRARRGSRARSEITCWVADKRARCVPTFVIHANGLDSKKIVAKYGANVVFEKGKALPKAR